MEDRQPDTWYLAQTTDGPLIVKLFSGGELEVQFDSKEICNQWTNQEASFTINETSYTLKRILDFNGKEQAELYIGSERQNMLEMSMTPEQVAQPFRKLFIIAAWVAIALVVLMFILRMFSEPTA